MSDNKSFLRNVIGEYMTHLGDVNERVVVVNADLSGTCRNKDFVNCLLKSKSKHTELKEEV